MKIIPKHKYKQSFKLKNVPVHEGFGSGDGVS
jgi:hypothetical protein